VNPVDPVEKTSVFSSRQWLFVLARVYLGVSFFFSDHGNARPNELTGFLKFAAENGYSWYQHFLNSFVVPHSATFGMVVVVAEIYVGIALIIGFTTRLASCVALFLLLNYMCAKGALPWGPGIDQSDIVLAVIILFSDAGRIFGIDKLLGNRFPKLWIW
jgi:uncharacterized membrane protein YphA (DoxX/SURF4 family)